MGIKEDLLKLGNPEKEKLLLRFFKTGKGEYGEGDKFIGVSLPDQRQLAKRYAQIGFSELQALLSSKIHEFRLTALLILVHQFKKAENKKVFVDFYLKNVRQVNNWDLVDFSAPNILGKYFLDKKRDLLYKMAASDNIWERRIAIISSLEFIRNNEFTDTLKIAEILLKDKHDLIHKAVGWMLREVGKRNIAGLEAFLKKHCKVMPRTMLRYSLEKFDSKKREFYMRKD